MLRPSESWGCPQFSYCLIPLGMRRCHLPSDLTWLLSRTGSRRHEPGGDGREQDTGRCPPGYVHPMRYLWRILPFGPDMDHTPRQIFACFAPGSGNDVLKSNAPWYCVSCYLCTVRCPQEIRITDLMYTLKRMSVEAGLYEDSTAPDLSGTFMDYVERYGRSFEFGLATRHNIRHRPLSVPGMAPLGLGMLAKGRMGSHAASY